MRSILDVLLLSRRAPANPDRLLLDLSTAPDPARPRCRPRLTCRVCLRESIRNRGNATLVSAQFWAYDRPGRSPELGGSGMGWARFVRCPLTCQL